MKRQKLLLKFTFVSAFLAVLILTAAANSFAQEQKAKQTAQTNGGAALSTGVFSLASGRTLRISAVNAGGKTIPVEIYIVPISENGKAGNPIPFNAAPAPGDAALEKFTHPGGVNRISMYVQVRIREDVNDIKELVPSVEVVDEQTGRTEFVLSGTDFVSIRPIFIPPIAQQDN
ncbi:MAG: hypothetical protein M3209_10715 [Acidobacteriota bacterium]|nr:hypothetical protein [Acidobacteriota bacterium]